MGILLVITAVLLLSYSSVIKVCDSTLEAMGISILKFLAGLSGIVLLPIGVLCMIFWL